MVKSVDSAMTSVDNFIEDNDGNFDWAEPVRRPARSSKIFDPAPAGTVVY